MSTLLLTACGGGGGSSSDDDGNTNTDPDPIDNTPDTGYNGSGSLTQGLATTITDNLFSAGIRAAAVGTIDDDSGNSWTVPALVNYQDTNVAEASDLHNVYVSGHDYASSAEALAALDDSDIIEIDTGGEVITAYIFADNYFELYVNGVAISKDPVPFTEFNSSIVRFRVSEPYTLAIHAVDWEENLGTGTEANGGDTYHPGDAGFVAVFKNSSDEIVAATDNSWKAQTFYTAPIVDLSCLSESGEQRLSTNCTTNAPANADDIYAVHWELPEDWASSSYDDSGWPAATTYSNNTVGVDNKPSYTNFTDVFDDSDYDAQFVWSSNLILDNEVLLRTTVGLTLASKAVKNNQILPLSATCDGADGGSSIDLYWDGSPVGTQSYAITMHHFPNSADTDLSAAHSYWTLYNIPAATTELSTGQSDIGTFGTNTVNDELAYTAPCSQGTGNNAYTITLYALSSAVDSLGLTASNTDLVALTDAIADHTLQSTTLDLSRARYNTNSDDHVPSSVATDCATKSVAFEAYSDHASVSCDDTTMTVTTNTFLPYRSMLDGDKSNVGIQSWIGRVPIPTAASWTLPLEPNYLNAIESNLSIHDAIGITVEGIPILHYAKEDFNGEVGQLGTDYSARDTILLGEIDQCGGHAGNGEDYHYHMAPLCMMDSHDPSQPLAYMFDGLPLYFGTGGGVMTTGGTNYGAGRYTDLNYLPQDVKSGDNPLDECNAYDLQGDGSEYVYYTTTDAPYTIACYRATADQVNSVPTGPHWSVDRNLSWMGTDVELTDYDSMTFEGNSWTFIEITPGDNNNSIDDGDVALLMYRQLTSSDTDYDSNADCYAFRYRLDSNDSDGSNDTVITHCR